MNDKIKESHQVIQQIHKEQKNLDKNQFSNYNNTYESTQLLII